MLALFLLACVHVLPAAGPAPSGCQLVGTYTTTLYLGAAVEMNASIGRNRVARQAVAAGANKVVATEANVYAFQRASFRADGYRCAQ